MIASRRGALDLSEFRGSGQTGSNGSNLISRMVRPLSQVLVKLWIIDQRPRVATPEARDLPVRTQRYADKHVCRIALARISGARLRGGGGKRCGGRLRHSVWGDGYQAALVNYQYLAHAALATADAISKMR